MKAFKITFCVIFFVICAFFSTAMLIPGASRVAEGGVEMPRLVTEDGINSKFGTEFEEYFSRAFAFRGKAVELWSAMKVNIFGEGNEQVTVGSDDFLFFSETLDSYTGANPMTDDEISKAADSLKALSDYAESHGAKLIFVGAPNKNTIYSEKMPSRFVRAEMSDLDRFLAQLDARGVTYYDPRPDLLEAKASTLVYHRRDTHWNPDGAKIAFDGIASALGFTPIDVSTLTRDESATIAGDLDTLLYPDKLLLDAAPSWDFSEQYIFTSAFSTPMDMQISTRGGGKAKMLVFRDSFCNALIDFFAASSSECKFERSIPYRIDQLESFKADYVVVEIAERNLRELIGCDYRISPTYK